VFDTLTLARKLHPGQKNSLDALCKRYNITHFTRDLHGALLDSEILAQVYLAMTSGQEALFAEDRVDDTGAKRKAPIKRVNKDRSPLPVIKAKKNELAEHREKYDW